VWAHKRFVAIIAALVVGGLLWAYISGSAKKTVVLPQKTYRLTLSQTAASGGTYGYTVRAAETAGDQARGLGNRNALPEDQGMLFVYNGDRQRCFWMKDMRFAIDMIWVDSNKAVTHIEPNVQPDTYPQTFCYVGSYVIELNAGEAARNSLQTGQKITF
jgi:uncharacterized membrane protein (UPF0127 family)